MSDFGWGCLFGLGAGLGSGVVLGLMLAANVMAALVKRLADDGIFQLVRKLADKARSATP